MNVIEMAFLANEYPDFGVFLKSQLKGDALLDFLSTLEEFNNDALEKKGFKKSVRKSPFEKKKKNYTYKNHLKNINDRTSSVKEITRKGKPVSYIHKGNTFVWHSVWKKMDIRIARHEGKKISKYFNEEDSFYE